VTIRTEQVIREPREPDATVLASRPVRLGLIGTGLAVARLHWPALVTLRDHFTVVAYTDPDAAAAGTFARQAALDDAAYTPSAAALLARDDVDAVLVAVPIPASYGLAAAALAAGKHVLCEKPPGGTVEEGRAFLALTQAHSGLAFVMGENFFYRDDLRFARQLLDDGVIGTLRLADFRFVRRTSLERGEFAATGWRRQPRHRGGVHLDVGVHHVAQLRMLCGEPVGVQATLAPAATPREECSGATSDQGVPADGAAGCGAETFPALFAHLQFHNGVWAAYQAIYDATTDRPGATMALYGTAATLLLEPDQVTLLRADGTEHRQTFAGGDNGYRNEWLDFYRAIHDAPASHPVGTVAQSFRNLLVIMRALDAAHRGVAVEIEAEEST
jgi:predicted dehydrogenase